MNEALLNFLKDSNLQKILLAMGFFFCVFGLSGLTFWKNKTIETLPRIIFTILGITMMLFSGVGYFENKDGSISALIVKREVEEQNEQIPISKEPTHRKPKQIIAPQAIVKTDQRGDNNSSNSFGTVIGGRDVSIEQRNNSDDNQFFIRGDKKIYYEIKEGDTIIIDEEFFKSKGIKLPQEPDFPDEEFYEQVEDWLSGTWGIKSQYNFNYNARVSFSPDYTFVSYPSGDSKSINGTWQLKEEGTGKNKRYVLYLHHSQSNTYNTHSNELVIISFSTLYLWKNTIKGVLLGEMHNSYTTIMRKE